MNATPPITTGTRRRPYFPAAAWSVSVPLSDLSEFYASPPVTHAPIIQFRRVASLPERCVELRELAYGRAIAERRRPNEKLTAVGARQTISVLCSRDGLV